MPLDTAVHTETGAVRDCATWLGGLAGDVDSTAEACLDARRTGERAWAGDAGEAFGGHMGRMVNNIDTLGASIRDFSRALSTFADEFNVVKERMPGVVSFGMGSSSFPRS